MWITLDSTRAKQRLTGAEFNAIKSAALNSGQDADTLVTEELARITKKVRGYVSGCKANVLGADGTIPDELEASALAIWVVNFITRVPNMKSLLDANRVKAQEQALTELDRVATCKFGIVPPENGEASESQPAGAATEIISTRTRIATREGTNGLL